MNAFINYINNDDNKVNNVLCTKVIGELYNSVLNIFIYSTSERKNEMAKATANKHVVMYLVLPLRQEYMHLMVNTININIRQSLIKL